MSDVEPMLINCGAHGERVSAVVCGHMIGNPISLGFIENSSDPNDLQAWCSACERMYLQEGDKTEAFLAFNQFTIVCVDCYADLRARHMAGAA